MLAFHQFDSFTERQKETLNAEKEKALANLSEEFALLVSGLPKSVLQAPYEEYRDFFLGIRRMEPPKKKTLKVDDKKNDIEAINDWVDAPRRTPRKISQKSMKETPSRSSSRTRDTKENKRQSKELRRESRRLRRETRELRRQSRRESKYAQQNTTESIPNTTPKKPATPKRKPAMTPQKIPLPVRQTPDRRVKHTPKKGYGESQTTQKRKRSPRASVSMTGFDISFHLSDGNVLKWEDGTPLKSKKFKMLAESDKVQTLSEVEKMERKLKELKRALKKK